MARPNNTKGKRVLSSSSEDEYEASPVNSPTSPVPNSRKSAKTAAEQEQEQQDSDASDKENSFTESEPASRVPGTAKKALRGRVSHGSPSKRRLSSRADDMRRQSFTNLRFLEPQSSTTSIDGNAATGHANGSAPSSGSSGASGQQQQQQQQQQGNSRQTMGGRIAGLAAARGRSSLGNSASGLLGADGAPAEPAVSREAMTENYEEWMKMATDNKINATNTWNFALIDYFHDMSLLRNVDEEGSINFQKASCTLDGCVKIWTSRVDSTATAVGKLMSGLAEEHNAGDDAGDDEEGGGSDQEEGRTRRKRTTRRTTTTLADDFSKIQQKQLDLEFAVDPLFRKTCADFDEGGASGILMNHLGCDRSMRIVFDAGDCKMDDIGDEGENGAEEEDEDSTPKPVQSMDVSKLKVNYIPDLDALDDMAICPTLSSFKFSSDDSALDLDFFKNQNEEREQSIIIADSDAGAAEDAFDFAAGADGQEDFFAEAEAGDGGFDAGASDAGAASDYFNAGGDGLDDDQETVDGDNYYMAPEQQQQQQHRDGQSGDAVNPIQAMAEGNQQGVFDYFDAAFTKNWAGPEHWKMRRAPPALRKDETATASTARQRKEKQPFLIDFEGDSDVTAAELFAKPKARAPSTLMKATTTQADDQANQHLLPDDMHFNSASLLRLFLKPKAMINMRRKNRSRGAQQFSAAPASGVGVGASNNIMDQDIDEHYWAQAAADQDAGGADFGGDMDEGPILPFSTQFLNDDDEGDMMDEDDVDMDVGTVAGGGSSTMQIMDDVDDDLLAATQGQKAKRARPEYVSFAKRAKRVDVKRLKENIWKELAMKKSELDADESIQEDDAVKEEEPKSFTNVLTNLRQSYPKDKMDEISTSFCFICLLHLANENNLSIKPPGEEGAEMSKENISSLMALEILKDQSLAAVAAQS